MDDEFKKQNNYEGNGWTQYQLLVMQTLNDHTAMFKSVIEDINDLKKQNAVLDIIYKGWRDQYDKSLLDVKSDIVKINNHIHIVDDRLKTVEELHIVQEKTEQVKEIITNKSKAYWGIIGGIVVFVMNIIIEIGKAIFPYFFNK